MTSAERILKYGQLEQEEEAVNKSSPADAWPERGNIEFQQLSLVYYDGAPPALQNVNFGIKDKERVWMKSQWTAEIRDALDS